MNNVTQHMTLRLLSGSALLIAATGATGCTDDIRSADPVAVRVELDPGQTDAVPVTTGARVEFYNVSSGAVTAVEAAGSSIEAMIMPGFYNVSYTADTELHDGLKGRVSGQVQGVAVISDGTIVRIPTFTSTVTDDLIVSELYFTGSLQSSSDNYNGDQYIKLYNNTDHVVYADGLTIFESSFLTVEKYVYTPDIIAEAMTVDALYTIPGSGTDVPVLPGQELLLSDCAIDHRAINPNSIDLSHSDFEWYDVSSTPYYTDIDNPQVPNLDKWYCYTFSVWYLHNRGFKAYGIARIPVAKEEYLNDYYYDYEYDNVTAAGTFPMTKRGYRLDNEWIVDLVTCSIPAKYAWNVSTPSLDMGWTYCGEIDGDKNRYFRAVRRAVETVTPDGRVILRDTNNSTADFNPFVVPSEVERQHAAIDSKGTPCTTLTYDGIMPIE